MGKQNNERQTYFDKPYAITVILCVDDQSVSPDAALCSLEAQELGFSGAVQLIVVDCSRTGRYCKVVQEFVENHPDNVTYLQLFGLSLSAARNKALALAEGYLVTFMSTYGSYTPSSFGGVMRFVRFHGRYVDYVAVPMVTDDARSVRMADYRQIGELNRVVSLVAQPHNHVTSVEGTFFKGELFDRYCFSEDLGSAAELEMLHRINRHNSQFGFVRVGGEAYLVRSGGLAARQMHDDIEESCASMLEAFSRMFREDTLCALDKEVIIRQLCRRLRIMRKDYFLRQEDYDAVMAAFGKWVSRVGCDFIVNQSRCVGARNYQALLLRLAGSSFAEMVEHHVDKNSFLLSLMMVDVIDGKLCIEALCNTFGVDLDLIVVNHRAGNEIIRPVESDDLRCRYAPHVGELYVGDAQYRRFELPLRSSDLEFVLYDAERDLYHPLHRVEPGRYCRVQVGLRGVGIRQGGWCVSLQGRRLYVDADKQAFSEYLRRSTETIQKAFGVDVHDRMLARQEKRYVLVSDRPWEGGDNGQALFEHIMKQGPADLRYVTYFVADADSEAYRNLAPLGHVVKRHSQRHKYLFLNAVCLYTSHNNPAFYNPFPPEELKYYRDLLEYQTVWLQHGIIMQDLSDTVNRFNNADDFVVTSTRGEYEELSRPPYFYGKERVLLSGMPRCDKLRDDQKRVIAVMPKWRRWLVSYDSRTGSFGPVPDFDGSHFQRFYQELLSSKRLAALLEKYDYTLEMMLHPHFGCYRDSFVVDGDRCRIVSREEVSYTEMFARCSLAVTDYSSAMWDVAYLHKPIVYACFDEEEFYGRHSGEGYFTFRRDGFGPVVTDVESLLDELEKLLARDCAMEKLYRERVDNTFAHIDQGNCARVLAATWPVR